MLNTNNWSRSYQLDQAMSEGKGKEVLGEILENLVSYAKAQFRDEERMMMQNDYPDLIEHKRQHALLTEKGVQLSKGL